MVTFIYTVDEFADEPIMLIDRHVGFDEADGFGIMGDMFQRELLALDGMNKKRIQVWINSPGGVVSDGYNIFNAILKTKTKVDTYCIGIAASIAAVIFQAGRTRYMADYGQLMYHNPFGGDDKSLDAIRDSLITMISSRTGKPDDDVKRMMSKTTWMSADEALEHKFCDEIEASSEKNKKRVLTTADEAINFWKATNTLLNNTLNKEKKPDMKKVANKLNLNPEATEESIISEIDRIGNKLKAADEVIKNKDDAFKKKQEELDVANKKVTDLTAEMDTMKAKAKEDADAKAKAEAEAKEKAETEAKNKAESMIKGFVEAGRIKNDAKVIASWTNKAIADFDGVKELIEGLPINKKSEQIVNKFETGGGKLGSVIANKMVALQAAGK